MGPQLCSCGNNARPTPNSRSISGFNGAATLQLRKHISAIAQAAGLDPLQWGRNFAVAETAAEPEPAGPAAEPASMGPQLCSCGNLAYASRRDHQQLASMGPQLCSCGNRRQSTLQLVCSCVLQWGRNFAVAETEAELRIRREGYVASMGPQLCSCGNITLDHQFPTHGMLQWGRNFAVAETCRGAAGGPGR